MIRRKGLGIEDVERCASDLARLQRSDQGCLVDDRAARRVDQPRRRLHERQLDGADQPGRPPTEHKMNGHDVGIAK